MVWCKKSQYHTFDKIDIIGAMLFFSNMFAVKEQMSTTKCGQFKTKIDYFNYYPMPMSK